MRWIRIAMVLLAVFTVVSGGSAKDGADSKKERGPEAEKIAREVANLGWIVFTAWGGKGDKDLFVMRPNGAALRNITNTPEFDEYGGRFSPDGKRLLHRRLAKGEQTSHSRWGARGVLVVSNADGSAPVVHGKDKEYPWASWGPKGERIACLYKRDGKIRIHELASKKILKEIPRTGIYEQMFWSPDGARVCGTATVRGGGNWSVVNVDSETQALAVVSRGQSCTSDWFQGGASRMIFSHEMKLGLKDGSTILMQGSAEGKDRGLVYGEHPTIYGGCTSPDGRYVVLVRGKMLSPMAVVRLADTPMAPPGPIHDALKEMYPDLKEGPILHLTGLPRGFEPHWANAEIKD